MSAREPFVRVRARYVVVPHDDIDTDQIIPARFLKTTDKAGLGKSLFADWRRDEKGDERPDFPLSRPDAEGARVLVAGNNFGCGSSREHAPWALVGAGFSVVIARSFADIFKENALKNGLLPVAVDADSHARILAARAADPRAELDVDLTAQTVTLPDGHVATFTVDAFSRDCLLRGVDELGALLARMPEIEAHEARNP